MNKEKVKRLLAVAVDLENADNKVQFKLLIQTPYTIIRVSA